MKQQHHPLDIKNYQKGINADTNKELLGPSEQGDHVDALNMRSMSMDGDNFAKKKILGEELEYGNVDNRCFLPSPGVLSADYVCMMTEEINGHIFEVWASTEVGEDPFIRIDGQIVLMSPDFPVDLDHPLQYHKNENCVSGEVYITNHNTPPMVFSVKDLMDNSGMTPSGQCTQKYFADFDLDKYIIQTTGVLFKPAFIKQVSGIVGSFDFIAGAAGLPVGSYSYSYRYVTQEGDRTPFSPFTELIPIVRNVSDQHAPYFPNSRTYSSEPNITSVTGYGNHIRIKYENTLNFSFLEIRRDAWYSGSALDVPPVSEIISSIPISNGLNVVNFLDRVGANEPNSEPLDFDEVAGSDTSVQKAKSVRYFNDRLYLMNISYKERDVQDDVTFVDDVQPLFPTVQKIGKKGHSHPYNATMFKSNARGEKNSFAVVLFDDKNSASYATPVPGNGNNFQFPNRRKETSSLTEGTSYFGTVFAANTDGSVTQTHEVFDHYDSVRREDFDDSGGETLISFKQNDPYRTLNPTSQFDQDEDFRYIINKDVGLGGTPNATYNPKAFGLDYYAMGAAFKGIASYPQQWSEGFSVVKTPRANRVVAQGMGFYDLRKANGGLFGNVDTGKGTDWFRAYFPDLELLYPDVLTDLENNPSAYKIQLVSPLGYWSEIYTHINDVIDVRDKGCDMIVRPMILRDGIDYSITPLLTDFNPGLGLSSGIKIVTGTTDYNYVAYGRYTNYISTDSPAFPSNANGDTLFNVLDVSSDATYTGRQSYLRLRIRQEGTNAEHYNETGMRGYSAVGLDANDDGVMEWREPMYVINLVRDVSIPDSLTTDYRYGANYIKFKSKILESNGSSVQSAILVSERWEDCIPNISGQVNNAYSGLYRFIYVVDQNGTERRWLNVTFESPAFITALLANMAISGFDTVTDTSGSYDVYGIYTSSQSLDDQCPVFTITFTENVTYPLFTVPASGTSVYVKYDNRIPVRVFDGDTYINESVWAVLDNETGSNGEAVNDESRWRMNAPFPFKSFAYGDGYRVWQNSDIAGGHNYTSSDNFKFNASGINNAEIRQMITMWTAETRINLSFAFNNETPEKATSSQYYPLINYIPRPHKWRTGNETDILGFENDNHLNPLYYQDYGFEWNLWPFGGFRFTPQTNIDYSKHQSTRSYISVPLFGFEEQGDFCTRIIWSERRPINIQDTPTVKTFLPQNYFDISDDTGEIKFAWSSLSSDKGNNLYAFTDSGVCLLLVDKRIIHEINANELATVGSDVGGILNQLWIDRTNGMSDETWRSWAENSNAIYFVNERKVYSFIDNQLTDLTDTGFFEMFTRLFASKIGDGYESKLCGVYNSKTSEYYFNVSTIEGDEELFSTMIYGVKQQALQCQSSYNYDKYLRVSNRIYGMKDAKTFLLDSGHLIDGEVVPCYVTNTSDKDMYFDKEFIRIRVNSSYKPTKIYFYDGYEDYISDNFSSVVDATSNPIAIKDYFGYECYIPRKLAAPNNRQQGRVLIYKIVNENEEDFLVTTTGVQYKALK